MNAPVKTSKGVTVLVKDLLITGPSYGEPFDDNTGDAESDGFYFDVRGPRFIGGHITGYLNLAQFNWLAEKIGAPKIEMHVATLSERS